MLSSTYRLQHRDSRMFNIVFRNWYRNISSSKVRGAVDWMRKCYETLRVPHAVRIGCDINRSGNDLPSDPGIDPVIDACVDWLRHAQDKSASRDGGVAAHYSHITKWATSYPETTGYIVPTILDVAHLRDDNNAKDRAKRMLDWLVAIQFKDGGFQGGHVASSPSVPVVFNTGQILLGLAAGDREFGTFREPVERAADWLVTSQDSDGCWRRHSSPFTARGDKVYDTHAAWGLLEADSLETGRYKAAAIANVRWALTHQRENGFFDNCCLNDVSRPLTHTLGYALRGIIEAYRVTKKDEFLAASLRTANGLLRCLGQDGFLPGRVTADWRPAVDWACLTGTAQIAYCWLALYGFIGERQFLDAGRLANSFVRRTVRIDGPLESRGGVQGSYPIDGGYKRYSYISWGAKFCIDSNLLEASLGS